MPSRYGRCQLCQGNLIPCTISTPGHSNAATVNDHSCSAFMTCVSAPAQMSHKATGHPLSGSTIHMYNTPASKTLRFICVLWEHNTALECVVVETSPHCDVIFVCFAFVCVGKNFCTLAYNMCDNDTSDDRKQQPAHIRTHEIALTTLGTESPHWTPPRQKANLMGMCGTCDMRSVRSGCAISSSRTIYIMFITCVCVIVRAGGGFLRGGSQTICVNQRRADADSHDR